MRKALTAAVMCCTALSSFVSTTAFAFETPVIIHDDTGLTPQEACEEQLRPIAASGFLTEAIEVSVGGWVDDGPPYQGESAGPKYGVGTPSYSAINAGASGGFYRNGGSPNVWGTAVANATIYPQTGQDFNFYTDQTRTTTFGCHVFKDPGNAPGQGPDEISPPGLQTTGNTTAEHQTRIFHDTHAVITEDDFTAPGAVDVNTLICISPNNVTKAKPGTWTPKHGFTGSCTAASTAAGTTFIPSNNNPLAD